LSLEVVLNLLDPCFPRVFHVQEHVSGPTVHQTIQHLKQ